LNVNDRHNKLQQILSPNAEDAGVWIHQDAWFHLGNFDNEKTFEYTIKKAGNGVYAFVLKGKFLIDGVEADTRDGFGISGAEKIDFTSLSNDAELLLMEVPMQLS
jgi:redox-sensitive bicupin YhaK (pirin superfamily)